MFFIWRKQQDKARGREKTIGITTYWPIKCMEVPILWEHRITRFIWGVMAKHGFNPTAFYFDRTLTTIQTAVLPADVQCKSRVEAEQTLIYNLYLCLGYRGQDELHNQKTHLYLANTRVLDEFETVFKKERNETFETFQFLSRKQRDGETVEMFHSVLSGRGMMRSGNAGAHNTTGCIYCV